MTARRRPFGLPDVPVPTGAESAEYDRRAIDERGVPRHVLMENAGRGTAVVVQRLFPRGPVLGLVGPGNNGGDALVALRSLAAWGREVRAVVVGDRAPDGLLHDWRVSAIGDGDLDDAAWADLFRGSSVVLDGLLGTGIRGAPRERQAAVIRRLNGAHRPVVSLDIPSGADADTGAIPGEVVEASATVCFGFPKLGAVLHPARARVGRLVALEIGFPPPAEGGHFPAALITPGWAAARRPRREPDTHKNAVGALLVVAGRPGMAGAAVLAARGALRSGAGLVRVASPGANRGVLQAAVPEAIFVDADDTDALAGAAAASSALAVGPGMGTDAAAAALLEAVLDAAGPRPLLLDADGLNLLAAGRPLRLAEVAGRRPTLVTPHPGEIARLAGRGTHEVVRDRPGVARALAAGARCTVLLKGAPSLVAGHGGDLLLDTAGSSDLATGGMGDVLTGVVASFMAQGLDPERAAGVGLFVSGRAAALAGAGPGLLPTDVAAALPRALREDGPGETDLDVPGLLFDQDPAR